MSDASSSAPFKQFEAVRPTENPVTFKIGDETFECLSVLPGAWMVDLFAAETNAKSMKSTADFLDRVLLSDSAERFAKGFADPAHPITLRTATDITLWLVGVYSGNPTDEPSPSPDGSGTTSAS